MDIRQQLYYVVEHYLKGDYPTSLFCDVFYDLFYPDQPREYLSLEEFVEFEKLGVAVSRYSQYPEDHLAYPNAFSNDEEIKKIALDVFYNLTKQTR